MTTYSYEHQLCETLDRVEEMDWESPEYFEHRWDLLKKGDVVHLCLSHMPSKVNVTRGNLGLWTYDTKYATFYYDIDDDYGFDDYQDYWVLLNCIKSKGSNEVFASTNAIDTHYECSVEAIDKENEEVALSNKKGDILKLTKDELFAYAWQYKCCGYKFGMPTF